MDTNYSLLRMSFYHEEHEIHEGISKDAETIRKLSFNVFYFNVLIFQRQLILTVSAIGANIYYPIIGSQIFYYYYIRV